MNQIIKEVIIKILNESDDYSFLYDKVGKQMEHGVKTSCFINRVQVEVFELHHERVTAPEVMKTWTAMRTRFVKLNKDLSTKKNLTDNALNFYKSLIFLEDHISHVDTKVKKLEDVNPQNNECTEEDNLGLREALGSETYSKLFPSCPDESLSLEDFPDVSHLFREDETAELEILDYGFIQNVPKIQEPIIVDNEKDSEDDDVSLNFDDDLEKNRQKNIKNLAEDKNMKLLYNSPSPIIIDDEEEDQIASKNIDKNLEQDKKEKNKEAEKNQIIEDSNDAEREELIQEICILLASALSDCRDFTEQCRNFSCILSSINKFAENIDKKEQ